jgi:hypothetical protein
VGIDSIRLYSIENHGISRSTASVHHHDDTGKSDWVNGDALSPLAYITLSHELGPVPENCGWVLEQLVSGTRSRLRGRCLGKGRDPSKDSFDLAIIDHRRNSEFPFENHDSGGRVLTEEPVNT